MLVEERVMADIEHTLAVGGGCIAHNFHAPDPKVMYHHHVIPPSWGGENGPTVPICPTGDANVHRLIDAYVDAGGQPAWEVRKHYGVIERALAEAAWAGRPSDTPPLTTLLR